MTTPWPEETFLLVRKGIELANDAYCETLPRDAQKSVEARTVELNATEIDLDPGNLNVVIFHVKIPAEASQIIAPDIRNLDHDKVDYETLIKLNIELAIKTNPRSRVFLLTDNEFGKDFKSHRQLAICRLPSIKAHEPMYERVLTMLAYAKSNLFDEPTVFLDSDAFLIRPIHNLFFNNFDIGLTHRNIYGQMPVNEGVIFSNKTRKDRVQQFFEIYLASYLSIERDSSIEKIYQNLRRWRGGQLSVNSAANLGQLYCSGLKFKQKTRIAYLPCSGYNLSQIEEHEIGPRLLEKSCILHLKGPRKSWIKRLTKTLEVLTCSPSSPYSQGSDRPRSA